MRSVGEPREPTAPQDARWLARVAVAAIGLSVALMVLVGLAGPSAAVPAVPGGSGWPPYAARLALAWAAYRSPRVLAAVGAGAAAVLVPSYLVAGGRAALVAQVERGGAGADLYEPWQLLYRVLDWHDPSQRADLLGAVAAVLLAALLLWRLPDGPPGLPAIRPSLALSMAWLVTSPQQRPWFDAMIFSLLAVMPATRLDWIALGRAVVGGLAELPGVTFYTMLRPPWLAQADDAVARDLAPLALLALTVALIWLCVTRRWLPGSSPQQPPPPGPSPARAARVAPGRSP
jgi:hypothetical protein